MMNNKTLIPDECIRDIDNNKANAIRSLISGGPNKQGDWRNLQEEISGGRNKQKAGSWG